MKNEMIVKITWNVKNQVWIVPSIVEDALNECYGESIFWHVEEIKENYENKK